MVGPADGGTRLDGVSVSTTVTGWGVFEPTGAVVRLVTTPWDGAAGVSVCKTVLGWTCFSGAAMKRVVVEACAAWVEI